MSINKEGDEFAVRGFLTATDNGTIEFTDTTAQRIMMHHEFPTINLTTCVGCPKVNASHIYAVKIGNKGYFITKGMNLRCLA